MAPSVKQQCTTKAKKEPKRVQIRFTTTRVDGDYHVSIIACGKELFATGTDGAKVSVFDYLGRYVGGVVGHRGRITGLEIVDSDSTAQYGVGIGNVIVSACYEGEFLLSTNFTKNTT